LATQIDLLTTLQEIDQQLQRKELLLQELRQQVSAISSEMEKTEQEAQTQQQRMQELEAKHRDTEGQLKLEEEKIKEKRVRLNRIRNERELLATQREIELMREEKGKLEDDTLALLEKIEQGREGLTQNLARIEELKTHHQQEASRVDTQITVLEQETLQERTGRESLVKSLDQLLCNRYERIFAKCGGVAVVKIQDETCQGCRMRIPPHTCNQIQRSQLQQSEKIFYCPHCARIVYWPLSSEQEQQEGQEAE
jgi:predicted  nucleic acid-binding Zn-ribbon protein